MFFRFFSFHVILLPVRPVGLNYTLGAQKALEMNLDLRCDDKGTATNIQQLINDNKMKLVQASGKIIQNANMSSEIKGSSVAFKLKLNTNQMERLRDTLKSNFTKRNKPSKATEEIDDFDTK